MRLKAAVFDLDGVVTRTAAVHFAAWKEVFDAFLRQRATRSGEPFRPFTAGDYRAHVDGLPRYDGVRTFLAARGMSLPAGDPSDAPGRETVAGIGRSKNEAFLRLLEERGVHVYESTVRLIRELRERGVAVGVASSSRNCRAILERAGLAELFDSRVDGVDGERLGLRGKPAPDIFLVSVERLGAGEPADAMVAEDAAAGVEAGLAGGFGLVLGIDRGADGDRRPGSPGGAAASGRHAPADRPGRGWLALREHGADWIVRDMAAVTPEAIDRWLEHRADARPNALFAWPEIAERIGGRRPAVFLDADGSLAAAAEREPGGVRPAGRLRHLLARGEPDALPIRFGDGAGDEEAFRSLGGRGIGIRVAVLPRPTAAEYSLQDTAEMRLVLRRIARLATQRRAAAE